MTLQAIYTTFSSKSDFFFTDTFSLQYKMASASSQVHLAIQKNVDIYIFLIVLHSSARKKEKSTNKHVSQKVEFFFSINEIYRDINR